MNYVMEVGPLASGEWVLFCVDERLQVHLCAADQRDVAVADMVRHLAGRPAHCCDSLRSVGEAHGWVPAPPSQLVLEIAACSAVSVDNRASFGGRQPFPPYVDAWLRGCAMFLGAKPWARLRRGRRGIDVHFDGALRGRKVAAVIGDERRSSLFIADSVDALLDESGLENMPRDCLAVILKSEPSAVGQALAHVYHRPFTPRLLRIRDGALSAIADDELLMLTGVLAAVASLCRQRSHGRAVVEGIETIVLPLVEHQRLAS